MDYEFSDELQINKINNLRNFLSEVFFPGDDVDELDLIFVRNISEFGLIS